MPGRDRLGATWRFWTGVLRIAFRLGFRMRVVGVEHVPTTGAALLASNHVSSLDGMVLATVTAARRRRPTTFLIAAEYFRNPVLRAILSSGGQVPIRRGERDLGALAAAEDALRRGGLAGIYPEGGVNRFPDQGMRPLLSGAARLATATGAPVIPVGIWGTQRRWPWEGFSLRRPWRPVVGLAYGAPVSPDTGGQGMRDLQAFTDRLTAAIQEQLDRARALAGADR